MPDMIHVLLWYFAFLLSTVFHEASHAYFAYRLGDPTAYHGGQATLDPRPHIRRELLGTVIVPLVSFFMGGWMFGWASTPYDPVWARRFPRRAAWMSLAGPMANLMLVILAALLIHIGLFLEVFLPPERLALAQMTMAREPGIFSGIATLISIFFSLNLILCIFNLIPVPPLDGSGVIPLFLSDRTANRYLDFIQQTPFMFLGILVAWRLFDQLFAPIFSLAVALLYPGAAYR